MNFNPMDMFKNIQDLQGQVKEMQEKLSGIYAEGSSGGDLVKITINGKMEMIDIQIDPIAVDPRDVEMLQELIKSAYSGAFEKIQEKIKSEVGGNLSGLTGLGI